MRKWSRTQILLIFVLSLLVGVGVTRVLGQKFIIAIKEASRGGDLRSTGAPPAPLFSCFDSAVDLPDLKGELTARGETPTPAKIQELKSLLSEINQPWDLVEGKIPKNIKAVLDNKIKE